MKNTMFGIVYVMASSSTRMRPQRSTRPIRRYGFEIPDDESEVDIGISDEADSVDDTDDTAD